MRDHGWRTWASYEASYISWKGTCQCDIRYDRASQFLKILFSLDGLRCWGALGPGGGGKGMESERKGTERAMARGMKRGKERGTLRDARVLGLRKGLGMRR